MNAPSSSRRISVPRQAPLIAALALALGGWTDAGAGAATTPLAANFAQIDSQQQASLRRSRDAMRQQFLRRNGALPVAPDRVAGTVTVDNCDDSGPGSLRAAFEQAVSGDVVDLTGLTCSTISLTSGALTSGVDYLTLNGPGPDRLAIDANGDSRAIALMGTYGELKIDGLTIRNASYVYSGDSGYGGGIADGACVLAEQYVTISNSRLENCSASGKSVHGAAVKANGRLILTNSVVSGAQATATADDISATITGGAISGGATYLTDTTVQDVTVSATTTSAYGGVLGGGVFGMYGVVMTGSTVSGVDVQVSASKDAYAKGGGVASPMTVIMDRSTVADNSVRGTPGFGPGEQGVYLSAIGGGGVYIMLVPRSSPVPSTITNSTISGNSALCEGEIGAYTRGGGGALGSWAPVPVAIVNSTLSGNSTNLAGGALYTRSRGALTLSNATVTDNRADNGAAIADLAAESAFPLATDSSIVAGNAPFAASTAVDLVTVHDVSGANNLVGSANATLPADTLSGDPRLAPLADNGGPTRTHALLADSPAIDAGSNPLDIPTDQRGEGYVRVSGTAADIGAYESQPLPDAIFADGFD